MPSDSRLQVIAPDGVVPLAPYSPAIAAAGLVFVSGQVPVDERGEPVAGGIEAQTRRTFENMLTVLRAAGCELGDVVSVTNYLVDAADFAAFNAVYQELFQPPYPARVTVVASLLAPGIRVESSAIAIRPA